MYGLLRKHSNLTSPKYHGQTATWYHDETRDGRKTLRTIAQFRYSNSSVTKKREHTHTHTHRQTDISWVIQSVCIFKKK